MEYNDKRLDIKDVSALRAFYKNIVFTSGCFDILHSGHIDLFRYCKTLGKILVIGIQSDDSVKRQKGTLRPINNLDMRISVLESLGYIDYIVPFDTDTPYDLLRNLKPDVLVKGGKHYPDSICGHEFAGKTVIRDFTIDVTTSSIIQKLTDSSRKTVVHVWKQRFANVTMTNDSFFWGIGDMLRGSIGLYHLSKEMGFDLIVDTSHHPIGRFLKQNPHRYSNFIKNNIDKVCLVLPEHVKDYLQTNLPKSDILYFYTNMGLDVYNKPFTSELQEFVKHIIEPSDEFSKVFKSVYSSLPYHDYTLMHYRLGDDEIVREKISDNLKGVTQHMFDNTDLHTIAISDSKTFIDNIKGKSPHVYVFNNHIAHCGYSDDIIGLQNTLLEFFIAMKAVKIKTFTKYEWISGFIYVISRVFNIPLEYGINMKFN